MVRKNFIRKLGIIYAACGITVLFICFAFDSGLLHISTYVSNIPTPINSNTPDLLVMEQESETKTEKETELPTRPETASAKSETDLTETDLSETESSKMTEAPKEYTYTAVHSKGRLFIRSGPSMEDKIIGYMTPGSSGNIIELGSESDKWVLLSYKNIEGYVYKTYLEINEKIPETPH